MPEKSQTGDDSLFASRSISRQSAVTVLWPTTIISKVRSIDIPQAVHCSNLIQRVYCFVYSDFLEASTFRHCITGQPLPRQNIYLTHRFIRSQYIETKPLHLKILSIPSLNRPLSSCCNTGMGMDGIKLCWPLVD